MHINLETARYYSGLGDLVMWAWLARGAAGGPTPLSFYRTRNLELASMLRLDCRDEPGGLLLDDLFTIEVQDRCAVPRIEYLRQHLKIESRPLRPELAISDEDEEWGRNRAAEIGLPLVLLFPQTAWKTREWPASYWVDLAWSLHRHGSKVAVMLSKEDERFKNTPLYQWGTPLPRLAALMKHAALVIGNDSFPAHLAGTVGVPTLALMGPTRSNVFAHLPHVRCFASTMECTGCHFHTPFRAACDQGCMSLFRLFPEDVLKIALSRFRD